MEPSAPKVVNAPSKQASKQGGGSVNDAHATVNANREQIEQQTADEAVKSGFPYLDSRTIEQIVPMSNFLTLDEMREYRVAPLHQYNDHSLEFGVTNLTDLKKLPELQQKLAHTQATFKTISTTGFDEILNQVYYLQFNAERSGDFKLFGEKLAKSAPKEAFQYIAQLAYWLRSSDIHIEPQPNEARIRFRIDGILHPISVVNTKAYEIFLSDLQTRAEIKWGSDEPQSGRISYRLMNNDTHWTDVNMRIETIPTFHGEEIVVRIFNDETRDLKLESMGFASDQVKKIDEVSSHPNGMVLTVGPTGSGKTSTLYAMINRLNNPEVKIVTLEDPVEYDLDGVSQVPVRTDDKELFAEKLRAVMREDPNVVMIGEIRDVDTAKTALQAALTGHLVLSTFHAGSASAAVSRMLDMIGQNPLFASAIRMIIAQRLARRICPHCAEELAPTEEELNYIKRAIEHFPPDRKPKIDDGLKLKHGKGCPECHGIGYKGRVAIIEMMLITHDIEQLMTQVTRTTAQDIEAAAIKNGMMTLLEDGVKKAIAGVTTISEIIRISEA